MSQTKIYANFGEFLTEKREERDLTLREMARQMEISAPFLSDVEKNRTAPLTKDRLDKVAEILHLDADEKTTMYDLVGKQRNTVAPDLPDYIMDESLPNARVALRRAKCQNLGDDFWQEVNKIIDKRSEEN